MARVLVLLPARDFDPSEAAVSWRVLVDAGHTVSFATPDGGSALADDMMLTGRGLDPWGAIPLLRNLPLFGLLMRANRDARKAYAGMITAPELYCAATLGYRRSRDLRRAAVARRASCAGHAPISGKRDSAEHCRPVFRGRKTGGGNLSRRGAGGAQQLETDGTLGALRIPDHRFDLGVRKQRLVGRAHHAILGSELLIGPIWSRPDNPRASCRCSRK